MRKSFYSFADITFYNKEKTRFLNKKEYKIFEFQDVNFQATLYLEINTSIFIYCAFFEGGVHLTMGRYKIRNGAISLRHNKKESLKLCNDSNMIELLEIGSWPVPVSMRKIIFPLD